MLIRLLLVLELAVAVRAQQESVASFNAQTKLILLSFHVGQAQHFIADLKAGDVVLLKDCKRRPLTILDSPGMHGRMPLELVLLFDVDPAIPYFWDPTDVFRFVPSRGQGGEEIERINRERKAPSDLLIRSARGSAFDHEAGHLGT